MDSPYDRSVARLQYWVPHMSLLVDRLIWRTARTVLLEPANSVEEKRASCGKWMDYPEELISSLGEWLYAEDQFKPGCKGALVSDHQARCRRMEGYAGIKQWVWEHLLPKELHAATERFCSLNPEYGFPRCSFCGSRRRAMPMRRRPGKFFQSLLLSLDWDFAKHDLLWELDDLVAQGLSDHSRSSWLAIWFSETDCAQCGRPGENKPVDTVPRPSRSQVQIEGYAERQLSAEEEDAPAARAESSDDRSKEDAPVTDHSRVFWGQFLQRYGGHTVCHPLSQFPPLFPIFENLFSNIL